MVGPRDPHPYVKRICSIAILCNVPKESCNFKVPCWTTLDHIDCRLTYNESDGFTRESPYTPLQRLDLIEWEDDIKSMPQFYYMWPYQMCVYEATSYRCQGSLLL